MSIRATIVAAIDSATRERDGLRGRVDAYFASASHILDQAEFDERSAADETAIVEAERQGSAGLQRIAAIDAHLERLNDLLAYLDRQDDRQLALAAQH